MVGDVQGEVVAVEPHEGESDQRGFGQIETGGGVVGGDPPGGPAVRGNGEIDCPEAHLDAVDDDRQGISRSIRARVERMGGRVRITSTPGRGTNVGLMMPRGDGGSGSIDERADDTRRSAEVTVDAVAPTDNRKAR